MYNLTVKRAFPLRSDSGKKTEQNKTQQNQKAYS
jgi:hypothetical protein